MTNDILARYEQAQMLMQGILTNKQVLNDAVFPHWIKDSQCFWYKRETRQGVECRLVDVNVGSNSPAFDHVALADALTMATGETLKSTSLPLRQLTIDLSPFQIRFHAFNTHWIFEPDSDNCLKKDETPQILEGLHSPDGKKVVFVRDYNLWMRNLLNGEERALTYDGTLDNSYGTAPLVPNVQALWSPDSKRLLTHQLDLRQVASRALVQHIPQDGSLQPKLTSYKAAFANDNHVETYRLLAISIETGDVQVVDYEPLPLYCAGEGFFTEENLAWWANDSGRVFFVEVARGAKRVSVVEFDTHAETTRILVNETADTFVNLCHSLMERPVFFPLPDTEELIWFSEQSGWAHLYLYDMKTGQLKNPITEGNWLVRNLLHVDISRREILLQSAARDPSINPYYRDICRVCIDTGELTPLASGDFEHVVYNSNNKAVAVRAAFGIDSEDVSGISPCGNYIVHTQSRVDTAPVSQLINRDGSVLLTLEMADVFGLPTGWQWPEPVKLMGADGRTDIYGVVYRPPGFSPDKSYPIIDFSAGHPGFTFVPQGSFVNGPCFDYSYLSGAAYAALGFVVVALEGRGTPYRHKNFQDYSYGNIAAACDFDDRIKGIQQLAQQYPYMDINRVGLVGCDGISGTVHGLLEHPEFYKVSVAICMADARFGPAAIVEKYEGLSINVDKKYRDHQLYAEDFAQSLKGKLLLMHGMLDTTAPMAGVLRLIDVLQQFNKDFDMLLLPSAGHDIPTYALRRGWDYLVTHLQKCEPPPAFELTTSLDLMLSEI